MSVADRTSKLKYLRKRIKLSLWSHIHFLATKRWMSYWNSSPFLSLVADTAPGTLQKIYRPYLSNRLSCSARVDTLIGHYAFIIRHGLGPIVLRAAQAPVLLGDLTGKSGAVYQLHLAGGKVLETEGELVLQISSNGAVLYSLAFTFTGNLEVQCVTIGCLQGPRGPDAAERVRKATRDLFGLRPKNLLLRLVIQLAHRFGCKSVILVSNANRVLERQTRKGLVYADYDRTWMEIGAIPGKEGDFHLQCESIPAPDISMIESRKRAEAKRRFALTDGAVDMIWNKLRRKPFSLAPEIALPAQTTTEATLDRATINRQRRFAD